MPLTTLLPRTLAKAYRDTDFIVRRADKDILLRVGSLNRRLHPLLKEFNCETWSFVTASNPGSRLCPGHLATPLIGGSGAR